MLAAIASVTYPPRTTGPKSPLIVNQTAAYFLLLKPPVEENGPLNSILKEAGSRTRSAGMHGYSHIPTICRRDCN
ncbi:hypothetical protein VHEMI00858 [[Torrubiella] hemipterigena]|uniref:Uncharacterized protein n=1 Tax=[Torrubiella] hemipterigena TaxID=1531966 RepID=A0A0A1T366_9HYPO|nr:hypothetical protein VHEMI00858 [[Torrubiella] hemipterigena]